MIKKSVRRMKSPMATGGVLPTCEFCNHPCETFDEYGLPVMNVRAVGQSHYALCYDCAVKVDEADDDRQTA